LVKESSEAAVRASWNAEETEAAGEFIEHARAIRAERAAAAHDGRVPNFVPLINSWGGVTLAYRRRLIDAPSYTLNHEEVNLALQEGSASPRASPPRKWSWTKTATPPR
jgi:hypothetical protein